MDYMGSVRWWYNSEATGYPVRYSKRHYCIEPDTALCGVRIPEEHKYNRWTTILEIDSGCGDVDCERCIAIADKQSEKRLEQLALDGIVADFKATGLVNIEEVQEAAPVGTSRRAIIAAITRLGGRNDGKSNWYWFE